MTDHEKDELIRIICKEYDTDEDDTSGCYYNVKWLSIAHICEIIRNADI